MIQGGDFTNGNGTGGERCVVSWRVLSCRAVRYIWIWMNEWIRLLSCRNNDRPVIHAIVSPSDCYYIISRNRTDTILSFVVWWWSIKTTVRTLCATYTLQYLRSEIRRRKLQAQARRPHVFEYGQCRWVCVWTWHLQHYHKSICFLCGLFTHLSRETTFLFESWCAGRCDCFDAMLALLYLFEW